MYLQKNMVHYSRINFEELPDEGKKRDCLKQ